MTENRSFLPISEDTYGKKASSWCSQEKIILLLIFCPFYGLFFVSFTGCIIWSKASGNRAIFSLPSFIERGELDDYFNRKMISRCAGGDGGPCDKPQAPTQKRIKGVEKQNQSKLIEKHFLLSRFSF